MELNINMLENFIKILILRQTCSYRPAFIKQIACTNLIGGRGDRSNAVQNLEARLARALLRVS